VFRVEKPDGDLAVKVYQKGTVHKDLLDKRYKVLKRKAGGRWSVPITQWIEDGDQILAVMPFLEDVEIPSEGGKREASLQIQLNRYLDSSESWELIYKLAHSLSELHSCQLAHGNLKPGNIFFDKQGRVLLSDIMEGILIPGVEVERFSDALLYASPEQIRFSHDGSESLLKEMRQWDVYAFGVLSYRLLTRMFPRCHTSFSQAAPSAGIARKLGVAAKHETIADHLEKDGVSPWPQVEEAEHWEEEVKDYLVKCFDGDAKQRPRNMEDVYEKLKDLNEDLCPDPAASERSSLIVPSSWFQLALSGIMVALMGMLGALSLFVMGEMKERKGLVREYKGLQVTLMNRSRELAEQRTQFQRKLFMEKEANREATAELVKDLKGSFNIDRAEIVEASVNAELKALRRLTDRIMSLGMTSSDEYVPSIKTRKEWLEEMESDLRAVIDETTGQPFAEEELARMTLSLAEVLLERGTLDEARGLIEAVGGGVTEFGDETNERYAQARTALALSWDTEMVEQDITAARTALSEIRSEDEQNPRWVMEASLALLEARITRKNGQADEAMERYKEVVDQLDQLSENHPDSRVMQYVAADTSMESTRLFSGLEMTGKLIEMRAQAAKGLIDLLKENPDDYEARARLGSAYGTIAEAALEASDLSGAEKYANAAIRVADQGLAVKQLDKRSLAVLGTQKGLLAVGHRERGELDNAEKLLREGMLNLNTILSREPENPEFLYRNLVRVSRAVEAYFKLSFR